MHKYLVCMGNANPGQFTAVTIFAKNKSQAIFSAGKLATEYHLKDEFKNPWNLLSIERKN